MTTTATPPSATAPAPKPVKKTPIWAKILLVGLVLLLIVGAAFAGVTIGKVIGASEERSVQVIRSVKGEEQVILATVGVGGIAPQSDNQNFFGLFDIPFSDREAFIQYDFDAKFGIEGKDVVIEPTGDLSYTITIPEFIFLGSDKPEISVATESNGVLSWVTPEIDELAAVEEILTDATIADELEGVRPLLESQAQTFYTRIVSAIEPEAVLTFVFTQ